MKLTDTHCHLDLNKFDSDRPDTIQRAEAVGVSSILIPGLSLASSLETVKLAESYPILYAAIGVHPTESSDFRYEMLDGLRELAQHPKVKAVGEIGLDYYWNSAPRDIQITTLEAQLDLAATLELPVVIHLREKDDARGGVCSSDLMNILETWTVGLKSRKSPLSEKPGVLHSFSGTLETARRAIGLNFFIGVTGPITFKNTQTKQDMIAQLPLEKLLLETDAPFLAPQLYRGTRNEPAYVLEIADKIAKLHSRTLEDVAGITTKNAALLFSWGEQY